MTPDGNKTDFVLALTELQDAFARVRSQLHVLRLATADLATEADVRALISYLGAIEDELQKSDDQLRRYGPKVP
jgi:hypothetical protein